MLDIQEALALTPPSTRMLAAAVIEFALTYEQRIMLLDPRPDGIRIKITAEHRLHMDFDLSGTLATMAVRDASGRTLGMKALQTLWVPTKAFEARLIDAGFCTSFVDGPELDPPRIGSRSPSR